MIQDSTKSAIHDHIASGDPLTKEQEKVYERLRYAYQLMRTYRNKNTVVKYMMKVIDRNGDPLYSRTSAYDYIKSAEQIYSGLERYNKEFLRVAITESTLKDIKQIEDIKKIALEQRDYDLYQKAMMMKDNREKSLITVAGLDRDDPEAPDYSKLKAHQYIIIPDNQDGERIKQLASEGGVIDLGADYDVLDSEEIEIEQDAKESD